MFDVTLWRAHEVPESVEVALAEGVSAEAALQILDAYEWKEDVEKAEAAQSGHPTVTILANAEEHVWVSAWSNPDGSFYYVSETAVRVQKKAFFGLFKWSGLVCCPLCNYSK